MKLIKKQKASILNINHYFNNGKAIRCDNEELFDKRNKNPYGGIFFTFCALRITR